MREYFLRPNQAASTPTKEPEVSGVGSRVSATGTDVFRFVSKGERAYLDIVGRESGREITAEAFERKMAERELLTAQSVHIAEILESLGVKAYGESRLTMFGLITGAEEPLINFRATEQGHLIVAFRAGPNGRLRISGPNGSQADPEQTVCRRISSWHGSI